jgi:hypothetical protein
MSLGQNKKYTAKVQENEQTAKPRKITGAETMDD